MKDENMENPSLQYLTPLPGYNNGVRPPTPAGEGEKEGSRYKNQGEEGFLYKEQGEKGRRRSRRGMSR